MLDMSACIVARLMISRWMQSTFDVLWLLWVPLLLKCGGHRSSRSMITHVLHVCRGPVGRASVPHCCGLIAKRPCNDGVHATRLSSCRSPTNLTAVCILGPNF